MRAAARYRRQLPQGQNPDERRDQFRQTLNIRKTPVIKRQVYDLRAGLLCHHRPRHKVGGMQGYPHDTLSAAAQTMTGATPTQVAHRSGRDAFADESSCYGPV